MGNKGSSKSKGPVAGLMVYSDHIVVSVSDSHAYSGLFISSTLFLAPKCPGLKDKLYGCSKIVAYLKTKKKSRVSGL